MVEISHTVLLRLTYFYESEFLSNVCPKSSCYDFLLQLRAKNWSQQNVTDSGPSTAHRSQVPEGINGSHWKAEDVAS